MKKTKQNLFKLGLALLTLFSATNSYGQFTTGNLVVFQVSDGVASFTNTGNSITMREFNTSGTATYSVVVPSTGTNALVVSGSATSEGGLSMSADKRYLIFAGYAQALPNATSLSSSSATLINRAVAAMDAAGNYTRIATSPSFHSGNNIRSAASDGNNNFWSAGANDGTDYWGPASSTVNIQNTNANTRCINTFSGNLYFSTGSGTQGVYQIGSGFPVTTGQATTAVITSTGGSPYAFYFNPSQTICYVADDRAASSGGGIQKWVYSSSTWSLAYTLSTGSSATVGARGVVADFSGTNPIVYATTAESASNRIISIVDAGSTSTASTIVTATTNTIFRGISFSPCSYPTISSVVSSGTVCSNQSASLTVNATSASSLTYAWTGTGSFSAISASATAISGAASGIYTVTVSNGCGTSSSTVALAVTPLPTLSISSSTTAICAGQTVSLTPGGATTYTWLNTVNNGTVSPTGTTVYTLTGTTNSCSSSSTATITVNPLPSVMVGSVTVCSGQPATLTASGANTYTWSNASNSSSIVITPTATISYSVAGTSTAGCLNTFTTQVVVTNSPSIVVNSTSVCAGSTATLIAGGANTFTWSTGANTNSIVVTPTLNNVTYTISGSLVGCAGVATGTASIMINSLPTLAVSGSTAVCMGGSVTQTLSGAQSYSVNMNASVSPIVLTPTATTNYTIMGTSANGCMSSLVTTLMVNPLPTLAVSGSTAVCMGSSVTQTLSGAQSYSVNMSASVSPIVLTPTATTSYTIMGANANGCMSSLVTTLTVRALPTLSISGSSSVCSGNSLTQNLSGATTYSWNGTVVSGSTVSVSPTANTAYTVTGVDANGCHGMATKTITVNATPTLNISTSSPSICSGSSATLTVGGAASYSWSATGSNTSIVVSPTVSTTYSVTGTSSLNCTATAQILQNVSTCTSIKELSAESNIVLYPNPASTTLKIMNLNGEKSLIVIYNALGAKVLSEKEYASEESIDISSLGKGIYFVQINAAGKSALKRLIVE